MRLITMFGKEKGTEELSLRIKQWVLLDMEKLEKTLQKNWLDSM